jgi:trans-aconitate methyltransferase
MSQTWDPQTYAQNAAFVHELAGGVLEWLAPQNGERILDLGCGDGQLTARLKDSGADVTGADADPRMVDASRARGIQAHHAAAESLPFAEGFFDAVFSNAALHWVRDQDAMMAEVRRVLKPGGRFVAEMGGHGNIAAIRVALMAALARHGCAGREEGENYYPTAASYRRRLERHGFDVERMALIPRPTPLGESGMAGWLQTFRKGVLDTLPHPVREQVIEETCELLAPALRDEDGNWIADYVRLRFVATAPGPFRRSLS